VLKRLLAAVLLMVAALSSLALGIIGVNEVTHRGAPEPMAQFCGLEERWRELVVRGYHPRRSGQISYLPATPIYFAGGGDGWSHSGPWPYLQEVPLVFYGPDVVDPLGRVEDATERTLADVAPTFAALVGGALGSTDGRVLDEVARLEEVIDRPPLKLIFTMVWDGAGWNTLNEHPGAWPTLKTMMAEGITYTVDVGSSPSVTPAIHTTLGTGVFPATHAITGVPVLDDEKNAVDPFLDGESGRFMEIPAVAERWDDQTGGRALIGMVGHVPWHLGMIGIGAERPGADKDHAAWLDLETNEWISNPDHYELPAALQDQSDLPSLLEELDAADGPSDGMWRDVPLDDSARFEEIPAFSEHHATKLIEVLDQEGYGRDRITDLMFTNLKQIDLLGHHFNMASVQVRDAIVAVDEALDRFLSYLDASVGRGNYMVVMTSDHGQQPSADALGSFGIDSNELMADLGREFGPVVQDVAPTEAFIDEQAAADRGVTIDEIARFLADYRLGDNSTSIAQQVLGSGNFSSADRVFGMAVPSRLLADPTC
jgi:hypothetical protein